MPLDTVPNLASGGPGRYHTPTTVGVASFPLCDQERGAGSALKHRLRSRIWIRGALKQ